MSVQTLSALVQARLLDRTEALRSLSIRDVSQLTDPSSPDIREVSQLTDPSPPYIRDVSQLADPLPPDIRDVSHLSDSPTLDHAEKHAQLQRNKLAQVDITDQNVSKTKREDDFMHQDVDHDSYQVMSRGTTLDESHSGTKHLMNDMIEDRDQLENSYNFNPDDMDQNDVVRRRIKPLHTTNTNFVSYDFLGGYDAESISEEDDDLEGSSGDYQNSINVQKILKPSDGTDAMDYCGSRWCQTQLNRNKIIVNKMERPTPHKIYRSKRNEAIYSKEVPTMVSKFPTTFLDIDKRNSRLSRSNYYNNIIRENKIESNFISPSNPAVTFDDFMKFRKVEQDIASRNSSKPNLRILGKHNADNFPNSQRTRTKVFPNPSKLFNYDINSNTAREDQISTTEWNRITVQNAINEQLISKSITRRPVTATHQVFLKTSSPQYNKINWKRESRKMRTIPQADRIVLELQTKSQSEGGQLAADSAMQRFKREASKVMFLTPMHGGIWTLCVDLSGEIIMYTLCGPIRLDYHVYSVWTNQVRLSCILCVDQSGEIIMYTLCGPIR